MPQLNFDMWPLRLQPASPVIRPHRFKELAYLPKGEWIPNGVDPARPGPASLPNRCW